MAKRIEEPVIKLTAEDRKHLDALSGDIERGEKAINLMKELGMDVKDLEAKLKWATTARDVLLREFV